MEHTRGDRRRDARFTARSMSGIRATLRPGHVVALVDLSAGGALVEAPKPLRPGARVHVQLVAAQGTFIAPAIILRCFVWAVHPENGVRYRGALRFEAPCPLLGVYATRNGSDMPGAAPLVTAGDGQPLPVVGGRGRARTEGS